MYVVGRWDGSDAWLICGAESYKAVRRLESTEKMFEWQTTRRLVTDSQPSIGR